MEFTINCGGFLSVLQKIIGVVDRKHTRPVLSFVLIDISDDQIFKLIATDTEIELVAKGKVEKASRSGAFLLPGKKLLDICKSLPSNQELRFTKHNQQVSVNSQGSSFWLSSLPVEDFSRINTENKLGQFSLSQKQLKTMLTVTHTAMSEQDVRHFFMGVLYEISDGKITAVASDGHRLSLITHDDNHDDKLIKKIILPRNGVLELLRLLEPVDSLLTVEVADKYIKIKSESFIYTSLLIDAEFPNYNHILPVNTANVAAVNKDELRQALLRTSILTNEKYRKVKFIFSNNKLLLTACNLEQERVEEKLSVNYSGETHEISFNIGYLLDALSGLSGENIKISWQNADSPTLFTQDDDSNIKHVIMPIIV